MSDIDEESVNGHNRSVAYSLKLSFKSLLYYESSLMVNTCYSARAGVVPEAKFRRPYARYLPLSVILP